MLARYNSEDGLKFFWNKSNTGGWKNPFGNINWNGNIKASVMPELAGLERLTSVEIMNNDLEALVDSYGLAEGAGLNFVRSVKDGSVSLKTGETALQGFQRGLVATSVKTKAATVAMKALSTIGWMALIAGISAVISKVSSLYSEMRETRQEAIQLGKDTKSAEDNLGKLIKQYQKLEERQKYLNNRWREMRRQGRK